MSWIRRTEPAPEHTCEPPTRERRWRIPASWLTPGAPDTYHSDEVPDGTPGDLWQCDDCRRVWTVRHICRVCGFPTRDGRCPAEGHVLVGPKWEPAGWWAQRRYRDRVTG